MIFWSSLPRTYKSKALMNILSVLFSSVCEGTVILNGVAGGSLLEKVVVVWELDDKCCG
jgi:hypothetical protein